MIYLHEFDRMSKFNNKTKSMYPYVESFVAGGKTYVLGYEDVVNCQWYWVNENDNEDVLMTFRRNPKVGRTSLQQMQNIMSQTYETYKERFDIINELSGAFNMIENEPTEADCVEITSVNICNDCYTEPWVSITDIRKIEVTHRDSWLCGIYEYVGEYDVFAGIPE